MVVARARDHAYLEAAGAAVSRVTVTEDAAAVLAKYKQVTGNDGAFPAPGSSLASSLLRRSPLRSDIATSRLALAAREFALLRHLLLVALSFVLLFLALCRS